MTPTDTSPTGADTLITASTLGATQPRPAMTAQATTDHDEGLVHDHSWACRERGAKAHP